MKTINLFDFPKNEIYQSFKEAFENYLVPLDLNQEMTFKRWEMAGLDFKYSYGILNNERLVAFVFNLAGDNTLYNFATGVIPEFRGKHLIEKIYQAIEDNHQNFSEFKLEVIRENTKAINLYQKLKFQPARLLQSYTGQLNISFEEHKGLSYEIKALEYTEEMRKITLSMPSFENSSSVCSKNHLYHELHELRFKDELLAYAIFTPSILYLKEVGANRPIKENLDQLFLKMKLNSIDLRVMNVDENAKELQDYLLERGMHPFVTQLEMKKQIN